MRESSSLSRSTKIIEKKVNIMTVEEWRKYYGDETLTEEQIIERLEQDKQKFDNDVDTIVGGYEKLDMDRFIKRIGGQEKIDQMKRINEAADKLKSVYGNVSKKEEEINKIETMENIEEWKKGFMDGFEEAYKRIYGK